jgi:nucleotide-binding universal stress UspA family protein
MNEVEMIDLQHVLCPVDFSESSTRALAHATALTRWYGAQLTVLHVVDVPTEFVDPVTRDEALTELHRFVEGAGVSPDVHVIADAGDASTTIVDQALATRTDLIVLGTHGRGGFKRLLLGSVAETVLHEAPCPVLTVSPHTKAASSAVVTFKRILCPIDFSPSALQALEFALNLARQAGGLVTLFHVVEWLPEDEPRGSAHFDVPEFRGHLVDDAKRRLRSLVAEESRTWCEIDEIIASGRAHREILRAAEAGSVDLIVMGAQGRGGVELALFGSTTEQVVRGAACPVLTVRGAPHT